MFTRAQLILIDPAVAVSHLDVESMCVKLSHEFDVPAHGFSTAQRRAAFIGQLCVESAHFGRTTENLNYSSDGLLKTFPRHFKDRADADNYAHHPEKIANRVYADRMGNFDEHSGDGWKYRGRGLIQLTGKNNYTAYHHQFDPDDLATPNGAVDSAIWFYTIKHNLNPFADSGDILAITRVINGGVAALDERIKFYNKALSVLQAS